MVDQKLSQARAHLLNDYPFWGYLLISTELIEDNQQRTMYTDGKVIGYNKDFIARLSRKQTMFCLAHEISHLMFQHIARRYSKIPKKWNTATDYVVNEILVNEGLEAPTGDDAPLLNVGLSHGCTAEQAYAKLFKTKNENKAPTNHGMWKEQDVKEWVEKVASAAVFARSMGKLPDSVEQLLNQYLRPKVDPYSLLKDFITQSVIANDFRMFPPSKKYSEIWLPSIKRQAKVEGTVVLDTSGSMSDEEIVKCLSWIQDIGEQFEDYTIRLLQCDAEIQMDTIVEAGELFPRKVKGRGGTDFRPPFKKIDSTQFLVYITDGMGTFPEREPDYPVIWLVTAECDVPWGRKVAFR